MDSGDKAVLWFWVVLMSAFAVPVSIHEIAEVIKVVYACKGP